MAYDIRKWVVGDAERRPRRRHAPWMIGAAMLAAALVAVAEVLDSGADTTNIPNAIVFAMPLLICALLSPFARDSWLTYSGRAVYDEFEQAALARATMRAYGLMLAVVTALFTYVWGASITDWPMPHTPRDWSTLGFAVLSLGGALPVLFAEIMVPLPPASDDDGEDLDR